MCLVSSGQEAADLLDLLHQWEEQCQKFEALFWGLRFVSVFFRKLCRVAGACGRFWHVFALFVCLSICSFVCCFVFCFF